MMAMLLMMINLQMTRLITTTINKLKISFDDEKDEVENAETVGHDTDTQIKDNKVDDDYDCDGGGGNDKDQTDNTVDDDDGTHSGDDKVDDDGFDDASGDDDNEIEDKEITITKRIHVLKKTKSLRTLFPTHESPSNIISQDKEHEDKAPPSLRNTAMFIKMLLKNMP